MVAAALGGQALVELDRPGLLEQVDHGVAVRAQAEGAAGVGQRPGRPDPVGQVALGGRADAGGGAGGAEEGDVLVGEVGGVDGGGPRAQHPGRLGQGGRGAAGGGQAGLVLGPLLGQVEVQGGPAVGGPGGDRGHGRRVDRPDAVDAGGHANPGAVAPGSGPLGPGAGVAVPEADLGAGQRLPVEPGPQVAGVDQGQPDPGPAGRLDQRLPHLVGIGVGPAGRVVVQVVELPDGTDPGQRHLGVGGRGQLQVPVRVEGPRDLVHQLPPAPEVAAAPVGATPQRPVERMRVPVGQPRDRDPRQPGRPGGRVGPLGHGRDPLPLDLDQHPLGHAPLRSQPGQVGEPGAHGREAGGPGTGRCG